MVTTVDAEEALFEIIEPSELASACNGKIWYGDRASDSTDEDIVINTLPIDVSSTQRVVANVNIYVTDIEVSTSHRIRNSSRIKTLAKLAMDLLEEVHKESYSFFVENQSVIQEPDIGQHFINFRILFQFDQTE